MKTDKYVLHLFFCFLEWSTIVVIITIRVMAPMTEPATIPARLPEIKNVLKQITTASNTFIKND